MRDDLGMCVHEGKRGLKVCLHEVCVYIYRETKDPNALMRQCIQTKGKEAKLESL